MSVTDYSWYSGRGTFRNGHSARAFDRVLGEPLAREVTRGLEARPPSLDDPLCSSALRFQCVDRGLDELRGDASPGKVVPDQSVPGAPSGEGLRPASGETPVVDRAGPNHSSQRLAARSRGNLGPRQPLRKLLLGEVTPRDASEPLSPSPRAGRAHDATGARAGGRAPHRRRVPPRARPPPAAFARTPLRERPRCALAERASRALTRGGDLFADSFGLLGLLSCDGDLFEGSFGLLGLLPDLLGVLG